MRVHVGMDEMSVAMAVVDGIFDENSKIAT